MRERRRRGRAACLALLVLASGCRATGAAPPDEPTPAPHAVRYRILWSADGITRTPGRAGWETTSDRGYRVRVTRGWVVSYSMELTECPRESRDGGAFLVRSAWAGHSSGTPNPAAIRPMQVESLLDLAAHDVGAVMLAPQAYCGLHYLMARGGHDSPGLPAELDMVDVSLHVEGTQRAPGAAIDTPFTIHLASAYGQVFARAGNPPAPIRFDSGRGAVRVEVRRLAARMFDGVDFATMTTQVAGSQILRSLVDRAEIALVPIDAGG